MLRFNQKPDKAFEAIVNSALDIAIDELGNEYGDFDENYEELISLFGKDLLISELETLLKVHKSNKLYMPTDYHFLVLDRILNDYIDYHNDRVMEEKKPQKIGKFLIKQIDFDAIHTIFFWDADYDLPKDTMNNLNSAAKDLMRFDKATFGVVNRMKPHKEDLILEEFLKEEWQRKECYDYYKKGKNYP
jgi:hypothetical protein